MINKKSVMTVSALLILMFHLWITVNPNSETELFLSKTAYIGVDIFFFLSAYSLSKKKIEKYGEFIISRFERVYLKFFLFALIYVLYTGTTVKTFLKIITFTDFFEKGGGAFLWFAPAILLFYIVFPFFQRLDNKNPIAALTVAVLFWLGISTVFTFFIDIPQLFILISRLPIIIIGYYVGKTKIVEKIFNRKKIQALCGLGILIIGYLIIYKFSYRPKLEVPFYDAFYVVSIVAVIGLVLLTGLIPEGKIIKLIGNSTFEVYAVQMIFGFDFMIFLTKKLGYQYALIINILSWLFVLIAAVIIQSIFSVFERSFRLGRNT